MATTKADLIRDAVGVEIDRIRDEINDSAGLRAITFDVKLKGSGVRTVIVRREEEFGR